MRTNALVLCLFGTLTFGLTATATAQSPEEEALTAEIRAAADASADPEMRNMRTMGMGEAFVGAGSGTGSLYHNPASILSAAIYEGQFGYQRGFDTDMNAIGVSLADAKTNPSVAAGVAYSFGFGRDPGLQAAFDANESLEDTNNRVRDHDIRAALAFPLVPGALSLGAGIRYVNHTRGRWTQNITVQIETLEDTDGNPETTDDQVVTTTTDIQEKEYDISTAGVTLDGGIMAQVGETIALGFAVHNILEINGLGEGRTIEGGIGGYFNGAHFEAAYLSEQIDGTFVHGFALGIEYAVDAAPIRAGFRYEGDGKSYLSGGFGYRTERVGGDFGFEQNVHQSSDRTLGASLALYF
jgi:hypothetical protein